MSLLFKFTMLNQQLLSMYLSKRFPSVLSQISTSATIFAMAFYVPLNAATPTAPRIPHLERFLCYIFPNVAQPPVLEIPHNITEDMMTPRICTLWQHSVGRHGWVQVYSNYTSPPNNPRLTNDRQYLAEQWDISAAMWRGANGTFNRQLTSRSGMCHHNALEFYMNPDILDDELFFGVLADTFDYSTWTFIPPIDATLTLAEVRNLDPEVPVYALPTPQDIPEWFRTAMACKGRLFPSFNTWLTRNDLVYQWFFPEQAAAGPPGGFDLGDFDFGDFNFESDEEMADV